MKRLLDSSTLLKWYEVVGHPIEFREVGNVGVVMRVFKPQYYGEDSNWIVEVYDYEGKRIDYYIPEELAVLVVPRKLRWAGMKEREFK